MQKIKSKFVDFLLIPFNGILPGDVETTDGVKCHVEYQTTWNNKDGLYDEDLDDVCQRRIGCPFSTVRSIWFSRLGKVDDYWHLIKMIKV